MRFLPAKRRQNGFSMVEAIVALVIVSVAGAALLVQFGGHSRFAVDAVDETIAAGIALQLMDEIAGCKFNNAPTTFGPSAFELAGVGRERYNYIDDYHGYGASVSPPVDRYGVELGTEDKRGQVRHATFKSPVHAFAGWRQAVRVSKVDVIGGVPTVPQPAVAPFNYLEVEVTVSFDDPVEGTVELARLRRVFSYIPPPP
jgi:prepilin-type N-terminal cleavage/methylation domain-containing protein